MNIFFTNTDPIKCAEDHCTVHMRKMIVEYAQMLSTAHHLAGSTLEGIYKPTHKNHPSSVWVRKSSANYNYTLAMAKHLCKMYTKHTGKVHKTQSVLDILKETPHIPSSRFTKPPVAAPDEYKVLGITKGVEVAYITYLTDKFKEWGCRDRKIKVEFVKTPGWFLI